MFSNALEKILEDMLIGYASVQLMIQEGSTPVSAAVTIAALRVGNDVYIYAIFAINVAVMLFVLVEVLRTGGWRGVAALDYLDPAALVFVAKAGNILLIREGQVRKNQDLQLEGLV